MVPCKARDAVNGHSLDRSHNAAWRHLTRNPEGRACFCAALRYSSFIWNNQTSLLLPCSAQNRLRRGREETSTDPNVKKLQKHPQNKRWLVTFRHHRAGTRQTSLAGYCLSKPTRPWRVLRHFPNLLWQLHELTISTR